jgi:hypothetical protein
VAAGYSEVINYLRGGMNNALDPSNIGDDQLQEAMGIEYRPPRQGIFGIGGRSRFDASGQGIGAAGVFGLVYTQYDVSSTALEGHRLVAFCGTSAMGASGVTPQVSFATLKRDFTSGATNFADGVHYGNNWFFWNGKDSSWVVNGNSMVASATHGFTAITTALVAVATAGGGPSTIGTYDVWITEYFLDGTAANGRYFPNIDPALESIYNATPASVTLSATGMQIKVTYPASVLNGSNIGFRIYHSVAGGKFPFGYAETQPSGATTVADNVASGVIGTNTYMDSLDAGTIVGYPYGIVQPPGGVAVSSKGAPPIPYDMAVFQDSLVAIDASDRQTVRYSLPDAPHAWPSTYYVRFETEKQDTLNALEVCNNALLVFSSWYGYRMDDLPRATDGDEIFAGRSRAKEPFSTNHGCIAPRGTCVFDIYGSGQLCAFVCRDGIHLTDGFKTDYLTTDLDWAAEVNLSYSTQFKLLNNPKKHRIEFYYRSLTLAYWARLDFYYYPGMLDASLTMGFPKLPMLGPHINIGTAATLGVANNDWQVWVGLNDTFLGSGAVATDSTGTSDYFALDVDHVGDGRINKRWRTKDWYHAGQGGEFEVERVYLAQAQTTASGTYTVTAYSRTDDLGTYNSTGTANQSLKGNQPILTLGQTRAQSVSLRGVKDDTGTLQEVNYIVWVVKDKERLMSAKSNV